METYLRLNLPSFFSQAFVYLLPSNWDIDACYTFMVQKCFMSPLLFLFYKVGLKCSLNSSWAKWELKHAYLPIYQNE